MAKLNIKVTILGSSFNEQIKSSCINSMKKIPRSVKLFVRDKLSAKRLKNYISRRIYLVSEVAFLLKPKKFERTEKIINWINSKKEKGKLLLGVNINSVTFQDNTRILKVYLNALKDVYSKNISFLLIPHDFRGDENDLVMLKRLYSSLPNKIKNNCFLVEECCAQEIKFLCSHLDFAITGRMHFAIACLTNEVPVGCISYQDKFEGLFDYFNLKDLVITSEEAFIENKLMHLINYLTKERTNISEKIKKNLPRVLYLSHKNFKNN